MSFNVFSLPTMALKYEDIANNPKGLVSFTGYRKGEFDLLAELFEQQWDLFIKKTTITGKERNRQSYNRTNSTFPKIEDKLMFILHYWKAYPLQEVMAITFGMKQPQVALWLKVLRPILKKSLKKYKMLPERDAGTMKMKLQGETSMIIDGTEREIQRPGDNEVQREYYSGKKKAYREK